MNTHFKNMGAKVFFIDTVFLEGSTVPCNFSLSVCQGGSPRSMRKLGFGLLDACWVTLSMQTFFLRCKNWTEECPSPASCGLPAGILNIHM